MEVVPRKRHNLSWTGRPTRRRVDRERSSSTSFSNGRNNFTHLRQNGIFSDAIIWVDSVEFPVHRNILACCSDYFRALFMDTLKQMDPVQSNSDVPHHQMQTKCNQTDDDKVSRYPHGPTSTTPAAPTDHCNAGDPHSLKESSNTNTTNAKTTPESTKSSENNVAGLSGKTPKRVRFEVTIGEVSPPVMNLVLEHAYGGQVNVTPDNAEILLAAADRFQVFSLVDECCKFFIHQLSVDTCISIMKFSSNFLYCKQLKQVASSFLLDNFESVYQTSPEFEQLTCSELTSVLLDDKLNVRQEETVINAIIKWVSADRESREVHIPALVKCIRLGSITPVPETDPMESICQPDEDSLASHHQVMKTVGDLQRQILSDVDYSMLFPRLPRDLLFIIGGSNFGFPLGIMEVFDCRTWRWNIVGPYDLAPRSYHGLACLDKDIYVIGGFDGQTYLSSCFKFSPETETMSWESVTPMNTKRCYVGVAEVGGVVYAIGGYDGVYRLNSAEKFDAASNQWSFIEPMSQQRSDAGVAVLDDKVYVCGGFSGTDCMSSVEMYNPATEEWLPQTPMPQGRSGLGVVSHNGCLYAVGGFNGVDSSVRLATMECYNPETRQWTKLTPMPSPRSNLAVAILEDTLYAIGGYNGQRTSGVVECYDFHSGSWYVSTRLSQNRSALSVCVVRRLPNTAGILGRDSYSYRRWTPQIPAEASDTCGPEVVG